VLLLELGSVATVGRHGAPGSHSLFSSVDTVETNMTIRDLSSLVALIVGMLLVLAA
jgi:hypothetical protein